MCEFCGYLGTELFNVPQPAFHKTLQHRKTFCLHTLTPILAKSIRPQRAKYVAGISEEQAPLCWEELFTKPWF